MDLTHEQLAVYLSTIRSIMTMLKENPRMSTAKLSHMLEAEINTVQRRVQEDAKQKGGSHGREVDSKDGE